MPRAQHGVPGSGKTSIIHGLAGELGLNVYVISLSRSGLDDSSLQQLIADLPERCIALIEDIDAAFHQNINRGIAQERDDDSAPTSSTGSPTPTSRISLSGVLNALDSLSAQEGRLLFSTTNRYSALDAALCRPGRMDLHVEFKLASKYQARELFKCFYVPVVCFEDETYRGDDKEKMDSGYRTPTSPGSIELDDSSVAEDYPFIGTTHRLIMPKLTSKQVADLAQQFGDAIPAREFSMASLQGYLMSYKIRPFEAVAFVSKWVEKERKKRRGGRSDVELE
jgi:chaperone BCS1